MINAEFKNHCNAVDEAAFASFDMYENVMDECDLSSKMLQAGLNNHLNYAQALMNESAYHIAPQLRRGRGAGLNPAGRFENQVLEKFEDDWWHEEEKPIKTTVQIEQTNRIISYNDSPDIPFDRSINPYRGCEHGCIYCYARPSHSYMGLSAGLDFETRLFSKPDAIKCLEKELSKPNYKPQPIALGSNTDPYQPIEKQWRITRQILELLLRVRHPVTITTKSASILRDIDILSEMARHNLVHVALSITTLDRELARKIEPRCSTPSKRLKAIEMLHEASVPVSALIAPVIPGLNDHEIENIVAEVAKAGAITARYILLRLPYEVAPLFREWLLREYPDRYRRVIMLIRGMRNGKDYDADWKTRMSGNGPFAELIARRFKLAIKRCGLNKKITPLSTSQFVLPRIGPQQLSLF